MRSGALMSSDPTLILWLCRADRRVDRAPVGRFGLKSMVFGSRTMSPLVSGARATLGRRNVGLGPERRVTQQRWSGGAVHPDHPESRIEIDALGPERNTTIPTAQAFRHDHDRVVSGVDQVGTSTDEVSELFIRDRAFEHGVLPSQPESTAEVGEPRASGVR